MAVQVGGVMIGDPLRGPLERAARSAGKRVLRQIAHVARRTREDLPISRWGLSRDESGELRLGRLPLGDLLRGSSGSPLHIVDADRLVRNVRRFQAVPSGEGRSCEVFYSYKTNPVPGVLRLLDTVGVGAEAASEYELWLALELGVKPEDIVYNGPARAGESLELAVRRRISLINLNSRCEIAPLAAVARRFGERPRIGIRITTPSCIGGQFGERVDTGAALRAFEEALAHPELDVVAVHSHVNGVVAKVQQLERFLGEMLAFTDELYRRFGLDLEILDVGGNLACPTVAPLSWVARRLALSFGVEPPAPRPEEVLTIDAYVKQVIGQIDRHYAARGRRAPRLFVEPGRSLTGDTQMLLCSVMSVRDPEESGVTCATLDAGINVAEILRSEVHQIFPLTLRPQSPSRLYRLSGPSCMLSDELYPAWRLPELVPGDGLAIMDSGAYFVPFSTCFSRPRPSVAIVRQGRLEIARRPETYEDMVALDGLDTTVGVPNWRDERDGEEQEPAVLRSVASP